MDVAWVVRTGDFPPETFANRRSQVQRDDARSDLRRAASQIRFETTPLMLGGTLYVSTPRNRVLALDPASGATRWTFDPGIDISRNYAEGLTSRGVAVWVDEAAMPGTRCASRVFVATVDSRLFALDGADGNPCDDFGIRGVVRLGVDGGLNGRSSPPGEHGVTSPPSIIRDLVVVGSAVGSTRRRDAASGAVRAFDVRTGVLRWSFDPIPRTADHAAWHHWAPDAARTTGGGNVWSIMSTDAERDLVFLPTATAAPDFFGGHRPGRNDFANAVVALRGSTGEVVWSFQVVHHDLWDYDVAAQPVLITLRRGGPETAAVLVGTKSGMIFVLDRETGVPLLPVEERPVPASDVPGEEAWPTQPFPIHTPLLHGTRLTPDSAFGINQADRVFCRERIASLRNEGIYTPPSLQGTLVWPGFWGGINWGGVAWDPTRQRVVTTVTRMPMVVQLQPRGQRAAETSERQMGQEYLPQEGVPYGATRMPLVGRSGVPCSPPPWASLMAVDLIEGSIRWSRPLGVIPALADVAGSEDWGSLSFGGPLVTAGGLVFIGASQDDRFRAFDIDSGELLWEYPLPAGGQAAPMTYRYMGRQYVVIAAGGRAGIGSAGDWIVAFALRDM